MIIFKLQLHALQDTKPLVLHPSLHRETFMVRPLRLYWRTVVALLRLLPGGLRNQITRSRYLAAPPPPPLDAGFLITPTTISTAPQMGDMKFENEDKFAEKIQLELKNTRYACSALEPLSRGSSNFMFKGTLAKALEDGTTEVAVKHSEGFVAACPQNSMATSRCVCVLGRWAAWRD